MNLKGLALHLQDQGIGTPGETVFVNDMPAECKRGVLLYNRYSGTPIDMTMPGWRRTGFRVAIRAVDYEEAENFAWDVLAALTVERETELDGMHVKQMHPLIEPRPYRRAISGYWEFEIEFSAYYVSSR